MGASAGADGLSGVHVHMSNTLNTPVEALEMTFPFRIETYALRRGSGGAGERRGGDVWFAPTGCSGLPPLR